ncbi:hypothetical protein T10_1982, partial [Trichinella papuae]
LNLLNFVSLVPMSVDGSPHRVPVFKRVFLSSLSKEIGSKWPTGKQEEKLDDSEHVSQISQIDISWTPPDLHKKRMLFSGSRRKWRYNFISHTKQPEECLPKATTSMRQTVFGHSKDENECPSKTACLMNSVCTPEILSSKDSPVKIVGRCDLQSSCREKKPMKANTLRRIQLRRTNSAKKLFQDFGSGGECGYCSEFFSKQDPTNDGKRAFECEINLHSKVEFNEYDESNDDMILISEWSDGVSQESITIQTSSQTSESCSVTVEATDHHLNSCSSNPTTNSSPVEFCHFAINSKRFNGRRRFIQGGFAEQFQKSIKRQMSNLNIWHHRRRNDNAFSKDNHAWFNKKEHENIQYELIAIDMEYGYYKCICKVARTSLKVLIIFHRYVFESYNLKCGMIFNLYLPYLKFFCESKSTPVILTPSLIDIFCAKMPHSEFYTFDTFAYYQDCNPLLWFIMIKNVPSYFPSQCKAQNKRNIFDSPVISVAERRVRFMGSSSRDAGINITDVICAPSLKCIDLADRFVEGYESKLEEKDKILEIKIDGGFSESIQHYHVHEQLKANIMECGYRIDKTHETSYKCPENCNNESSIKMNERVTETLKSIRSKYSDSTNRTMVVFVDKCLEPALRFLIKQPLIALELYVLRKLDAEDDRKEIEKGLFKNSFAVRRFRQF